MAITNDKYFTSFLKIIKPRHFNYYFITISLLFKRSSELFETVAVGSQQLNLNQMCSQIITSDQQGQKTIITITHCQERFHCWSSNLATELYISSSQQASLTISFSIEYQTRFQGHYHDVLVIILSLFQKCFHLLLLMTTFIKDYLETTSLTLSTLLYSIQTGQIQVTRNLLEAKAKSRLDYCPFFLLFQQLSIDFFQALPRLMMNYT